MHNKIFDMLLELKDAGAVTSSGATTVGGEAAVLQCGEGMPMCMVVDVASVDATGDNVETLVIQGASDAAFTTPQDIARVGVTTTGRNVIPFINEYFSTAYKYVRMYHELSGTAPTINYTAFVSKL